MYVTERADKVVNFVKLLRHTQGEFGGKLFNLQDFQEKVLRDVYGNILENTNNRVVREALLLYPRKVGKTEFAAALALNALVNDDEYGAEIYFAANTRDQAGKLFVAAASMVRQNKALRKRCKIVESRKRIVYAATNSFIQAVSADAKTADGYNASFVVYDEIHEAPNRDLYDKLMTSMGARRQPLFITITTAGKDEYGVWYELFEYGLKIKKGLVDDPTFYPSLFFLDKEEDWELEENWCKVNPSIAGGYRHIDEMRRLYKKAKETPSAEASFRRLYLNQITHAAKRWMHHDKWKASGVKKVNIRNLMRRKCYGGLDLSSVEDITAFVLVFPLPDGFFTARYWYFIPEDKLEERIRTCGVNQFRQWVKKGYILTTPGDVVDYAFIKQKIYNLAKIYSIQEIAYDRWNATQLTIELADEGFEMVGFGQGFGSMSFPTKALQKMVLSKHFINGGNPVTDWMSDNMVLKEDPAGNVKPDKQKSKEKIDGMVALIMGIDRAVRHENARSTYDEGGLKVL